MFAKVTKEFRGCRDGERYPVKLKVGDELEGDIARVAVESGLGEEIAALTPPETKPAPNQEPAEGTEVKEKSVDAAPKNKAKKAAPRKKSGA